MPILEYFIKKINGGIEFLAKHKDFAVGVIIALAGAITAYALPSMIRLGIATVTAFAPFYLIGAIVAGVAVTIGLLYEDLMVFLEGGTSGFQNMLEWLGFTGEEIEAIRQAFVLAGEQIGAIFATLGTIIKGLFGGLVAGGRVIFETFEPVLKLIGEGLVGAIKTALGFIDTLSNAVGAVADWLGFGDKDVKITKEDVTKKEPDVKLTKEEITKKALDVVNKTENNPLNTMTPNTTSQMSNTKTQNNQVKIDKIEIQTQATDSQAISKSVGANLQSELKSAVANFDDGIEA